MIAAYLLKEHRLITIISIECICFVIYVWLSCWLKPQVEQSNCCPSWLIPLIQGEKESAGCHWDEQSRDS